MPAARPSAATLRRTGRGQAGSDPSRGSPSPWALLVQGDVSVGLCHAWPLGTGLPEPIGPGLRWGPGAVAVLRVPPLQGLSRVQAERDRDDRQQADVPGTGQRAASARMPRDGIPLLLAHSVASLLSTQDLSTCRTPRPPSQAVFPKWGVGHRRLLPSLALAPQPCSLTDTSTPPQQPSLQYGLRNTEFKPVGPPLRVKRGAPRTVRGEVALGTAHSPLGQRNIVVAEERWPVAKGQFPPKLLILRPPGDFWDGAVMGALYWTPRLGRLPWQRMVLG